MPVRRPAPGARSVTPMVSWTLALDDPDLNLATGGGKAVNLGRLARAGFAVPAGFVVTTDGYRSVVAVAGLDAVIAAALADLGTDPTPAAAERASAAIRAAFAAAPVPDPLAEAVRAAYRTLGATSAPEQPDIAVAVRSSATAEDLSDLSFAGQQDTFLGVTGADAVLDAVVRCWSSLWTARAIVYRQRNGVPDDAVALAVVVQQLVPAEVSGVLFTANPLTGRRGETTIDATFGLGEALVSGQVEPDHYVLDGATGQVRDVRVGSKGGRPEQALGERQLFALNALGRRIEAEYAAPQDIEWAWHAGRLHVLQSRAITTLHPLPEGAPTDSMWLSFGTLQGMLDPITPLGRDAIRCVAAGAGRLFGHETDPLALPYVGEAAERLWIRTDVALRNPLGRRVLPAFLSVADPSARSVFAGLAAEGLLPPAPRRVLRRTLPGLARLLRTVAPRLRKAARDPDRVRDDFDAAIAAYLADTRAIVEETAAVADPFVRAAARGQAMRDCLGRAFPTVLPFGAAVVPLPVLALRWISTATAAPGEAGDGFTPLALELTRSLPRNVTTEMDLALWEVAATAAADPASRAALAGTPGPEPAREPDLDLSDR